MKNYIIETKYMTMEQGARTPVLNKSNFEALLTPGGRIQKQGHIKELCPMTPLIDQVEKSRVVFSQTPTLNS